MNLHLPQYTATAEQIRSAPTSSRLIKRWQQALPLVNMGDSTRQVYQTLRELNRQQLSPKIRFEVMEQLRSTAQMVLTHLSKHLAGVSYPLTGKSLQIIKLNHALQLELSVGYKHVIHDVALKNGKLDKKSVIVATHRAMRYLEESIAANAMTYRSDPTSSWHDIHRLQGFAEHNHFEEESVRDEYYSNIKDSTISDVFKQVCLLAMSSPLRLRTGESSKLRAYFETASHLAIYKRSLVADSNDRVHVVSLKSSEPPAYIPLADITTFSNLRGFDLTRLISTLSDMADTALEEGTSTGFSKVELDPQLIRRLINSWTTEEKRRFSRVSTERDIVAAVGLKQIIQAIQEDTHPEMSTEELFVTEKDSSKNYRNRNDFSNIDPHSIEARSDLSDLDPTYRNDVLLGDDILMLDPTRPRSQPNNWQNWRINNMGAGGYGLKWVNEKPSKARVGELMALREREYDIHHWRIGIIRWIKNDIEGGMEAGLQLIAPRALIVSVDTVVNRNHSEIMPLEAIMVPGMKAIKQPPSILVPSQFCRLGDILEVSMLDKKIKIELENVGEKPSFYTQFFYRSYEMTDAPAATASSREEFEDLWNRL